jgi:hypothetical protein
LEVFPFRVFALKISGPVPPVLLLAEACIELFFKTFCQFLCYVSTDIPLTVKCYSSLSSAVNAYSILVGKHEGKRPLGRPRCRWEDIKVDLREIRCEGVDWLRMGTMGCSL